MTMNIETKIVHGDFSDYLKFGWSHTEDKSVRHGPHRSTAHILARDKDMPNYRLVAALDAKYFTLKPQLKTYVPADAFTAVVLFLLFILPFVIYLVYKSSQKKKIDENNATIQKQMNEILDEVATLL